MAATDPVCRLSLTLASANFLHFLPLLQRGFLVRIEAGSPLRAVLRDQLGISSDLLQARVKTILLNGTPIDDLDGTTVFDGAALALSGALPGLAGAILRQGSPLASLRPLPPTFRPPLSAPGEGLCTLKLFNLLIAELGPIFLQKGILLDRDQREKLRGDLPEDFPARCLSVRLDGIEVDGKRGVEDFMEKEGLGELRVAFAPPLPS